MADEMIDLIPPSRRALNGLVLSDLIDELSKQMSTRGSDSLTPEVLEVMARYSPISCSNCMGRGHWADECPRRVGWFGQAQKIAMADRIS